MSKSALNDSSASSTMPELSVVMPFGMFAFGFGNVFVETRNDFLLSKRNCANGFFLLLVFAWKTAQGLIIFEMENNLLGCVDELRHDVADVHQRINNRPKLKNR